MDEEYRLSPEQIAWASKMKQRLSSSRLKELIIVQKGLCALSKVPMFFEKEKYGTPVKGGRGCHPLYAAVDHVFPGNNKEHQLVCYDLNDLKGPLPDRLFKVLRNSSEWKLLMQQWRSQAEKNPEAIEAFKALLRD